MNGEGETARKRRLDPLHDHRNPSAVETVCDETSDR